MALSISTRLGLLLIAGAAGTLARVGLHALATSLWPTKFPLGTLIVNVLGCLAFGVVWALSERFGRIPESTRFVMLAGFMGAFTTFSTFAFDTAKLAQDGRMGLAVANLLLSNALGIAAIFAGFWAASTLAGPAAAAAR